MIQDILMTLIKLAADDRIEEPGGFQKFVYTVAKRTCVAQCYKEKRRREREIAAESAPEPAATPLLDSDDSMDRRARLEALGYVLQQLSDDCRDLWNRIYCQGQSSADVAAALNITTNNVRVRAHRCLERARTTLRRYQRTHVDLGSRVAGGAR